MSKGYRQELSIIIKIYTKESKYGGNRNSFNFKLTIFHDICGHADILYKTKYKLAVFIFIFIDLFYRLNCWFVFL